MGINWYKSGEISPIPDIKIAKISMFSRYRINRKKNLSVKKLEIISGFIMKTTGKTIDVDMKRFCMANIYSSKITSKIFNDVLNNLSLDLFNNVVKSDMSIDNEFQNNTPKAI